MSLKTYRDVVQGTPEWDDLRRGMVTASVVGQLVTAKTLKVAANVESRSIAALLVAERITGYSDETFVGDDMMRGWMDEPRAIEKYSEHYAPITTTGFMVRDDWGFQIGFSPDGLVGDEGLVEVKSRRPKIHLQTILGGEVPASAMAQIQTGLLVSGRPWLDYISYCGGMPLWVRRVEPDPKWSEAIVAAVDAFEKAAVEMADEYHAAVEGLPTTERMTEQEMTF